MKDKTEAQGGTRPGRGLAGLLGQAPRLFGDAVRAFSRHDGLTQASALAFYALFSFIPAVFALIELYTVLAGDAYEAQKLVQGHLQAMAPFIDDTLMRRVRRLVWAAPAMSVGTMVFVAWSASLFFSALRRFLRKPWPEAAPPATAGRKALDMAANLVLGSAFIAALCLLVVLAEAPAEWLPRAMVRDGSWRGPWSFVCLTLLYTAIYGLTLPGRRPWRVTAAVSAGLSLAALGVTAAFGLILEGLPRYNQVYGQLAQVVLFLLWLQYNSGLLIFGGHLVRHWRRRYGPRRHGRRFALPEWIRRRPAVSRHNRPPE